MATEKEKTDAVHKPDWRWNGRSLENYKSMHRDVAKSRGLEAEFMAARTLTQARKIAFGTKAKQKGR